MKRKLSILLFFATFICTGESMARVIMGTESSGGGPSLFCPNATAPEGVAEFYDFFEGRFRYNLNIPETDYILLELQIEKAIQKMEQFDYGFAQDIRDEYYTRILNHLNYIPNGLLMSPVVDLGKGDTGLIPLGCQLVYAGYFEESGDLSISGIIYDKLSVTEKAGLLIHEAIYSLTRRQTKQLNSQSTRILTSFLFSDSITLTETIKKAIRTLSPFEATAKVINISKKQGLNSISFEVKCSDTQTKNDYLFWEADAFIWSSTYGTESDTLQGQASLRVSIAQGGSPDISTARIHFFDDTKLVSLNNGRDYYSGRCIGEHVEVYYANQKISVLPHDQRKLYIRIF